GYFGEKDVWNSQETTLPAGDSVRISVAEAIPSIGWWEWLPSLRLSDGSAARQLPMRKIACFAPLESRELPPEDAYWFGLDSRVRSPEMLGLFSAMGIDILRYGTWGGLYTEDGKLDWEEHDRVVEGIRSHGMQTLFSIVFTPEWAAREGAKGNLSRTPPDSDALRQSLEEIIPRLRDQGMLVYDLWNEPDHAGFWHGNVDDYLEFLQASYQTIKSIQPEATVLSGGVASFLPNPFHKRNPEMNRRLTVEGSDHFDALSLHEHGPFARFVSAVDGPVSKLQSELDSLQPLWFTETGISADARTMGRTLVQKITFGRARGADCLIWYALYRAGEGGGFNVIDSNGDPSAVFATYPTLVRLLRGKTFSGEWEDPLKSGNHLYAFEGEGETVFVAWGEGATSSRVGIETEEDAQSYDLLGRPLAVSRRDNVVELPFSPDPRYLVVKSGTVGSYEAIPPLVRYGFSSLKATDVLEGVTAPVITATGFQRSNPSDDDKRFRTTETGAPNGSFDGDASLMKVTFSLTPEDGNAMNLSSLGLWAGSGAFSNTKLVLSIEEEGKEPITVGSQILPNLSQPGQNAEHIEFDLSKFRGLSGTTNFSLLLDRGGERVIFKLDDLRVDGSLSKQSL
ncbi:MAG: hypothetical protein AAF357_16620, partial [Verrucomicrobiota bacterium]